MLGHLQRGGQPTAYDRFLALRFGCMVALDPPEILAVPLEEEVANVKNVPNDSDVLITARRLGMSFGD